MKRHSTELLNLSDVVERIKLEVRAASLAVRSDDLDRRDQEAIEWILIGIQERLGELAADLIEIARSK